MCLDNSEISSFSRVKTELDDSPNFHTIFIDHHLQTPQKASMSYTEPEATSTCELIARMYDIDKLDPDVAGLLALEMQIHPSTEVAFVISPVFSKNPKERRFSLMLRNGSKSAINLYKLARDISPKGDNERGSGGHGNAAGATFVLRKNEIKEMEEKKSMILISMKCYISLKRLLRRSIRFFQHKQLLRQHNTMNMFKPTTAKSVEEYIDTIPEPRRSEIIKLHKLIQKQFQS